ncbi:MAG TPA: hypothetical protein VLA19_25895 [Herpetosiphonaceae bacterium]|nr:hypothetical protein [Herpetosiphonaceae bacterium]
MRSHAVQRETDREETAEAEPRHIDAISRDSTLAPPVVSATLAILELKGLVKQVGGMQYVPAR